MKNKARNILLIAFIANLILAVIFFCLAPSTVAIHFGRGGEPNGWASSLTNLLIMSGFNVFLFLVLFFTPLLIKIVPDWMMNLPHRDYWLNSENRKQTVASIIEYMYQFGTLVFVFIFITFLLALKANLSNPVHLREDLFWTIYGLFMVFMIGWIIKFYLRFRIPKDKNNIVK